MAAKRPRSPNHTVFDAKGRLSTQAAHIPVHLGNMVLRDVGDRRGPPAGAGGHGDLERSPSGTDLPNVTLIAPLFHGTEHYGFVVNRAHHAGIGCATPGGRPQRLRHVRDPGVPNTAA